MDQVYFSIVVVSLNAGKKLSATVESILAQEFFNYEIVVKDGGSTDHSVEELGADERIRLVRKADKGIYDAMNQALSYVTGRYVLFLNCGDLLYDGRVLSRTAEWIGEKKDGAGGKGAGIKASGVQGRPFIFYGNQYNELQRSVVYSAPKINDFTCYRNVPCHQVCFYDAALFSERSYDPAYRVRADYEHFLYCIYERKAAAVSMPVLVARYEGGGFSETKENRRRSAKEHREITRHYLGKAKCLRYRLIMLATLSPVRTYLAENPRFSAGYNRLKTVVYRRLKKAREGGENG